MDLLYKGWCFRLEFICSRWHLTPAGMMTAKGSPEGRLFVALDGPAARVGALAPPERSTTVLDMLMLALAVAFFALSVGYAYACDRL